jgi:hypothetical protein
MRRMMMVLVVTTALLATIIGTAAAMPGPCIIGCYNPNVAPIVIQ